MTPTRRPPGPVATAGAGSPARGERSRGCPHRSRARRVPPPAAHRRPARLGGAIRDAETRAHAVVDHLLGAEPLRDRQPVAERARHAVDEDRGRHVLRVPARIGAHILLLGRQGGRIRSATAWRRGSVSALIHDATNTGDHTVRLHGCNVGEHLGSLKSDRISVGSERRSARVGRRAAARAWADSLWSRLTSGEIGRCVASAIGGGRNNRSRVGAPGASN